MDILREIVVGQVGEDEINIRDRIEVDFGSEVHFATAIKKEEEGILFLLDDYLDETHPMNRNGSVEGGYEESDMRKYLQELEEKIDKETLRKMMPFENGDRLRLLTLQEMFGLDEDWNHCEGQIEWMKDRKHRVAYRDNDWEWGWLATVVSGAYFAFVSDNGGAGSLTAGASNGVRPAFRISWS